MYIYQNFLYKLREDNRLDIYLDDNNILTPIMTTNLDFLNSDNILYDVATNYKKSINTSVEICNNKLSKLTLEKFEKLNKILEENKKNLYVSGYFLNSIKNNSMFDDCDIKTFPEDLDGAFKIEKIELPFILENKMTVPDLENRSQIIFRVNSKIAITGVDFFELNNNIATPLFSTNVEHLLENITINPEEIKKDDTITCDKFFELNSDKLNKVLKYFKEKENSTFFSTKYFLENKSKFKLLSDLNINILEIQKNSSRLEQSQNEKLLENISVVNIEQLPILNNTAENIIADKNTELENLKTQNVEEKEISFSTVKGDFYLEKFPSHTEMYQIVNNPAKDQHILYKIIASTSTKSPINVTNKNNTYNKTQASLKVENKVSQYHVIQELLTDKKWAIIHPYNFLEEKEISFSENSVTIKKGGVEQTLTSGDLFDVLKGNFIQNNLTRPISDINNTDTIKYLLYKSDSDIVITKKLPGQFKNIIITANTLNTSDVITRIKPIEINFNEILDHIFDSRKIWNVLDSDFIKNLNLKLNIDVFEENTITASLDNRSWTFQRKNNVIGNALTSKLLETTKKDIETLGSEISNLEKIKDTLTREELDTNIDKFRKILHDVTDRYEKLNTLDSEKIIKDLSKIDISFKILPVLEQGGIYILSPNQIDKEVIEIVDLKNNKCIPLLSNTSERNYLYNNKDLVSFNPMDITEKIEEQNFWKKTFEDTTQWQWVNPIIINNDQNKYSFVVRKQNIDKPGLKIINNTTDTIIIDVPELNLNSKLDLEIYRDHLLHNIFEYNNWQEYKNLFNYELQNLSNPNFTITHAIAEKISHLNSNRQEKILTDLRNVLEREMEHVFPPGTLCLMKSPSDDTKAIVRCGETQVVEILAHEKEKYDFGIFKTENVIKKFDSYVSVQAFIEENDFVVCKNIFNEIESEILPQKYSDLKPGDVLEYTNPISPFKPILIYITEIDTDTNIPKYKRLVSPTNLDEDLTEIVSYSKIIRKLTCLDVISYIRYDKDTYYINNKLMTQYKNLHGLMPEVVTENSKTPENKSWNTADMLLAGIGSYLMLQSEKIKQLGNFKNKTLTCKEK